MVINYAEHYRLDNVKVTGYTYNSIEETGKDDGIGSTGEPVVPGKTIAVDPSMIPYGSIVSINGEKYLANDTGGGMVGAKSEGYTTGIDMPFYSKSEALAWGVKVFDVMVYPPGSKENNDDIESFRATNDIYAGAKWSKSWLNSQATLSATQNSNMGRTPDAKTQAAGGGAGNTPEESEDNGILSFARFAESLAFKTQLANSYQADGTVSIHEYLSRFMSKFYHQLYYIPNLRNNYTIVVKPETLFIQAPTCNLVTPTLKSSLTYSRPYKQEPTRLLQVSDPIAPISGKTGGAPGMLICMTFVDHEKTGEYVNGLPTYKTYIRSLGEHSSVTNKTTPLQNMTSFEEQNGIRCSQSNKGADIYLYLKSQTLPSSEDDNEYKLTLNSDSSQLNGVGMTLAKLARYELCRQRYALRNGSIDMYFNPYIVPGFPFVSIENNKGNLNVYGYVTDVVHNITDRSWNTTVGFTCAHVDTEQSPGAYPIVESEYAGKISDTYKDMLGENVSPIKQEDVPTLMSQYGSSDVPMTQSLKKIWRETTSLDSYLTDVADGATIVDEGEYWWLQNGEGNSYFNTEVQERIKQYSKDIMVNKTAMSDVDVR